MDPSPAPGIERFSHLFLTLENPDDRHKIPKRMCDGAEEVLAFLGLEAHPFSDGPNPASSFENRQHEAARRRLRQGIEDSAPLCMLTAPIGMGKMLVLHRLRGSLPRHRYRTIELRIEKDLTGTTFLKNLLYGLGLTQIHQEKASSHDLITFLKNLMIAWHRKTGVRFVPLLMEAQFLGPDLWQLLRVISNIEIGHVKLATSVLFGDGALAEKLKEKEFTTHYMRVFIREKLTPLTPREIERHLRGRLALVNFKSCLFHPEAYPVIFEATGGIIRDVDNLAHNALIEAFRLEKKIIGPDIIMKCL